MKLSRIFICIAASILVLSDASFAQDERLSVEWIFSEEGKQADSVPLHTWLDSGQAILYDKRLPKNERTLEIFNPANGRRKAIADAEKVIAEFTELLQPDDPIEELGWPNAFDPTGRWAVYEKSDDIFILDLRSSELITVTMTDAKEKSARFSPDGKWLAFIRDNDLYVWNSG